MGLQADTGQKDVFAADEGFRAFREFAFLDDAPEEIPAKKFRRPPEETKWVKQYYDRFIAAHSAERKEADARDLKRLFNLAAKSPVMKQALDWAREHNIDFIIDRKLSEKIWGYYTPTTGVVAISAALFGKKGTEADALLASVLTHEVRHAWQEYKGISTSAIGRPSADYNIMIALIEADAMAHEQLAYEQYKNNSRRDFGTADKAATSADIARREKELEDPKFLWQKFTEWYGKRAAVYGDSAMQYLGSTRGVPGAKRKDFNAEFSSYGGSDRKGIDFRRREELRKLGKSFTGKNYLDGAPREDFDRKYLSPSLSRQFFDAARKADPVAVALRKKEMQEKKRNRDYERHMAEARKRRAAEADKKDLTNDGVKPAPNNDNHTFVITSYGKKTGSGTVTRTIS